MQEKGSEKECSSEENEPNEMIRNNLSDVAMGTKPELQSMWMILFSVLCLLEG